MQNKEKTIHKGSDRYLFFCPGCEEVHAIGPNWTFNDNFIKPTFNPSVLVTGHNPIYRCHSFITDGKIQFLEDCSHKLVGKTVELKPF